jgi:hypothetical protein
MRTLAFISILLASGCTLYFEEELGEPPPPPSPSMDEAFGSLRWVTTIGGARDDGFARVAVNAQGDVIVAAYFQEEVELDGIVYDGGENSSCFIMPLDGVDGTPLWVVPLLGYSCSIRALEIDTDGNVIVAGSYNGTFDFGGETLSNQAGLWGDMFVASYTPEGALRWVRGLGPVSGANAEAIAIGANGDIFVGGHYNGSSDLGGEWNPAENETEAFVVAYDQDGAYRWGHAFIADGWQTVNSISFAGGDLILSGRLSHDASFGGDVLVANASTRSWLARYTTDGEHVWSRTFGIEGGNASSIPTSVVRDDGTILVVTDESGDGSFPSDTMLRGFDLAGTELWMQSSFDRGIVHDLEVAPSGAVLLGGFVNALDPAAFGYSTLAQGMVLAAHDPAGIPIEGRSYDGTSTGNDSVTGVASSPLGATAIAGVFERTIDIGTGELVSAGGSDIVIAVFNAPGD